MGVQVYPIRHEPQSWALQSRLELGRGHGMLRLPVKLLS